MSVSSRRIFVRRVLHISKMVKLSPILFPRSINKAYWYKAKWKRQSLRPLTEPQPAYYAEQGFTVHHEAEKMKQEELIPYGYFDYKSDHPKFATPIPPGALHPLWQGGIDAFECNQNTRLLEGQQQAQVLTNTTIYPHAPAQFDRLRQASAKLAREDKSEVLQQTMKELIMQSVRWDPAHENLPPRYVTKRPDRMYARYRGITFERSAYHICSGAMRMCEAQLCENDLVDVLRRRWLENVNVRLSLDYQLRVPPEPGLRVGQTISNILKSPEHVRLQYTPTLDILLTSPQALPAFSNSEEVGNTSKTDLPSIYPVKETIDLTPKSCYTWDDLYLFKNMTSLPSNVTDELNPHTILQIHNFNTDPWVSDWSVSQRHAKALTTCFAVCGAQARRLYGPDINGRLPKPICVQLVFTNRGYDFAFFAYQLNTLDMHDTVRNQCWIDTRWVMPFVDELAEERTVKPDELYYTLFELHPKREGIIGYPEYREHHSKPRMLPLKLLTYNHEIYEKISAMALNGLVDVTQQEQNELFTSASEATASADKV